jgi:hypothetical protein
MPELAAGYLVGFLLTAGLVALHVFLQIRKQKSSAMRMLQNNLKKNDLFWCDSESSIQEYRPHAEKIDLQRSIKSILISGVAFMFFSWLGFVMQIILMMSVRYLAVKRIETKLFESELAEKELNPEKSREIIKELMHS